MKWLNLSADVTNYFPKNRALVKHELQKSYNVRFDEDNIQQHLESKAILSEYSKINENYKKMKTILNVDSKTKLENKKKKNVTLNIEDDVTGVFICLNNKQKQLKKKLQTLPLGQHCRRKSCQSSWSGGISKLEKKLDTRVWNNDKHLPPPPQFQRIQQKIHTISAVAKSKIVAKKRIMNRLKTKNPLLKKPSRIMLSNRVTPHVEGVGSSVKLSSETEFDTLSVISRHEESIAPPQQQPSHFRRYSQILPNTGRSREENGEPNNTKLALDGSPLMVERLGLQEASPHGRRKSRTVTETLAVLGSKEDVSPRIISIFGQKMQTPVGSVGTYTFEEAQEEKNEIESGLKLQILPTILVQKEDSFEGSKPLSPEQNKELATKELTNLKRDMKKAKGYMKHAKKRSLKKSKMSKSKVLSPQQVDEAAQAIQTEPTAEIMLTEPIEEIKTARSRKELAKIVFPPKAKSVAKVKNIYNNSLNFGLHLQDLKLIDNKSQIPFKETSRSPLNSMSREVKSTQLASTTSKLGSPFLGPSNPSINSHSLLSSTKNEKSLALNMKTLQDVVVEQKGLTERNRIEKEKILTERINKKSSIYLNINKELPQINKQRPKIQIKAWDENLVDRKNLPSGVNSCSSRRLKTSKKSEISEIKGFVFDFAS